MSALSRIVSCFVPCSSIKSEGDGVWTGSGLPVGTCPVTPTQLSLPQDDNCVVGATRRCQGATNRMMYELHRVDGLDAPWATSLTSALSAPPTFALGQLLLQVRARCERYEGDGIERDGVLRFSSFDQFAELFVGFDVPDVAADWHSDRVWADQFMVGVGPYTIERVTEASSTCGRPIDVLESKLSVDGLAAVVSRLDMSVATAIAQGRLYVADFGYLKAAGPTPGAPGAQSGSVPMAPIVLLARSGDDEGLIPLGVQMDQEPDAMFQVADDSNNWLYAKIFAQAACYQVATLVHHVAWHHMVAEAISVVTLRRLTQFHPLHGLLAHHIAGTPATNQGVHQFFFGKMMGEHMLTGKAGGFRLANEGYRLFHYDRLDFGADMVRRGVDDPALLPYYPVRDDGQLYWDLIDGYVSEYLDVFYGERGTALADKRIRDDDELQGWVGELSREAGGVGNLAGFPSPVDSFQQLHELLTRIIFLVGPSHATLNFPALLYALWLPNMPGAVYQSPPQDPVDEAFVVNSLPPLADGATQVEILNEAAFWFGSFLDYEDYFCAGGLCGDGNNARARDLVARTRADLVGRVQGIIEARNDHRSAGGNLPYELLLPGQVPNSLSA